MITQHSIRQQIQRLERDLTLFDRLFSQWSNGHQLAEADSHQWLDGIEGQLARLERSVTMPSTTTRRHSPVTHRPDTHRSATLSAAHRI
jgi:hypothetical protein